MNTKLTLRMDIELVQAAKTEAGRRGKSVSRMVGEYFGLLSSARRSKPALPPVTTSLVGILKSGGVSASDYRKHLREKYS